MVFFYRNVSPSSDAELGPADKVLKSQEDLVEVGWLPMLSGSKAWINSKYSSFIVPAKAAAPDT